VHANQDQTDQPHVTFRVLGPVEAIRNGVPLDLGGRQPRSVMAILVLHANHVVRSDQLKDGLWGMRWPVGATNTVQAFIARLRRALGEHAGDRSATIVTAAGGYMLRIDPEAIDLYRCQRLAADARLARTSGDHATAAALFEEALSPWDPEPLIDVCNDDFARVEIARLQHLRLGISEERFANDLDRGRHAEILGDLATAVQCHPTSERLLEALMTALYRCGRHSDALDAYASYRAKLGEEVGLDPSPRLRRLQGQILRHDPELVGSRRGAGSAPEPLPTVSGPDPHHLTATATPPRTPPARATAPGATPRWWRSRIVVATVVAAAAAVAHLTALALGGGSPEPKRISPNSLMRLEPASANVLADVPVDNPSGTELAAVPHREVWVLSHDDQVISIVDTRTNRRTRTIGGFGGMQLSEQSGYSLLYADGSVWVAAANDTVARVDPATNHVEAIIRIPGGPTLLARGLGHVWVLSHDLSQVYEIDPKTNQARPAGLTGAGTNGLAVGEGAVWVVNYSENTVSKIDPRTGGAQTITVGDAPSGIGIGYGYVWVSNTFGPPPINAQTLSQIDPSTGRVIHTIRVCKSTTALQTDVLATNGRIWVACPASHSIVEVNPTDVRVVRRIRAAYYPTALAVADGSVWVTISPHE
jgi:DNA-binding SARP family transcriptional activator/DNA-binding beta-propeller fold protein YncE